jgi:hypothetical protein
MLTAFARFGERAATIVTVPGIEGEQTAWKEVRGIGDLHSCRDSDPQLYAAGAAGAGARGSICPRPSC